MKKKAFMIIIPTLIFAFGVRLTMLGSQSREMNPKLGITNGKLVKCPNKPNCVNSFYQEDKDHFIAPLDTKLTIDEIQNIIKTINPEFKLIKQSDQYLYYTYESSIMGFVDDIEMTKIENQLFFRSSSRVGHSDMGANRKRIEKLKLKLVEKYE